MKIGDTLALPESGSAIMDGKVVSWDKGVITSIEADKSSAEIAALKEQLGRVEAPALPILAGKGGKYQIEMPAFRFTRVDGTQATLVALECIRDNKQKAQWEQKIQTGIALNLSATLKTDKGLCEELIAACENEQAAFITKIK